jgi:alkylhydroperoxidase/carboxymuconolactone decarboxylase family protein YurZ
MDKFSSTNEEPVMANGKPQHYQRIKQKQPQWLEAVEALGQAAKAAGPLDEKQAELIQLAAGAVLRSQGAVHSHARRALEAGASPDEVRHALLLLSNTIGFPTVMAALAWVEDVLQP